MSGRSYEVLLVQQDPQKVARTLDVLRNRPFAKRIRVIPDAGQALEFLLGSGPYADQQPGTPRLVLFHLGPGQDHTLAVLERIVGDPLTSRVPVTVLTDTADDRLTALGLLRGRNLHLPVVAITDLPSGPAPRRAAATREQPADQDDGAWIVAGAGERRQPGTPTPITALPRQAAIETRLDEQVAALADLGRRLAHEFNNLLTVVATNTELLVRDLDLDDRRRRSAEEVFRSVERASKLTAQLMTLDRIGAASASPHPRGPHVVRDDNRASAP